MQEVALIYEVGRIVAHPTRPEWGPGKVLSVDGDTVTVFFRDIPVFRSADAIKRICVTVAPLAIAELQTDPWLSALPAARDGGPRLPLPHFTPKQAVDAFRSRFRAGCEDPDYQVSERGPVWRAHEILCDELGEGRGETMLTNGKVAEVVKYLRHAKRTAGLLSGSERVAIAEVLATPETARDYLAALFDVINAPALEADRLRLLFGRVAAAGAVTQHESAWVAATLFPYLVRPDRYMLLSPRFVPKAASRLAFELHYTPGPNWTTYRAFLQLGRALLGLLAPFQGKDFIDAYALLRRVATASIGRDQTIVP